jgi:enoyl-CoA hydratase/carnithine racemase
MAPSSILSRDMDNVDPSLDLVVVAGITIAVARGACAGADFAQLLRADLRIAGDGATFSTAGLPDPVACARRLTALLGEARAKELLLGARTIDTMHALRCGLVTRVVPAAALAETTRLLLDQLCALPPLAVRAVRDAVRATRELTHAEALALEHQHFCRLIATDDHRAAVTAFFARSQPAFTGQ